MRDGGRRGRVGEVENEGWWRDEEKTHAEGELGGEEMEKVDGKEQMNWNEGT